MMKEIFKVEEIGFSETQVVDDKFICESPWTDIPVPQPCWKPKYDWNTNSWVETATDEEVNPPKVEEELTREEELAQQVSELEIRDMEKNILIEGLGQQLSDLEIMILGGKENE